MDNKSIGLKELEKEFESFGKDERDTLLEVMKVFAPQGKIETDEDPDRSDR